VALGLRVVAALVLGHRVVVALALELPVVGVMVAAPVTAGDTPVAWASGWIRVAIPHLRGMAGRPIQCVEEYWDEMPSLCSYSSAA
jgi:hypothetical protein